MHADYPLSTGKTAINTQDIPRELMTARTQTNNPTYKPNPADKQILELADKLRQAKVQSIKANTQRQTDTQDNKQDTPLTL